MPDEPWHTEGEHHFILPNQSEDFASGFACGRIWEQMQAQPYFVKGMAPIGARDTVEALAMSFGWIEEIIHAPDDPGFILLKLINPNPR